MEPPSVSPTNAIIVVLMLAIYPPMALAVVKARDVTLAMLLSII